MSSPGVNLSTDSSPAVSQLPHLLGVLGQHHVTLGEGSAHLTVPMTHFGQFCLCGGQNILLLIQLCFHSLHSEDAKEVSDEKKEHKIYVIAVHHKLVIKALFFVMYVKKK